MSDSLIQKIKKLFLNVELGSIFFIDKEILVYRSTLSKILKVTTQSIVIYEKKGLKRWDNSPNRVPMYELISSLEWYNKNINHKFKPNKQKNTTQTTKPTSSSTNLDAFLDTLPMYKREIFHMSDLDPMDKLAKLRDVEKKETANRKELEELIDKNDVDKNMTTLAGLLSASLINYEDSAPAELEGKTKEEIATLIYDVHADVFNELDTLLNKEFDCTESFYDVMVASYRALVKGATPEELVSRIDVNTSK